jgi:hypothetical protein
MKHSRLAGAVAAALLAGGMVATAAPSALASEPKDTGCPASYELLSVTWLESQGPYKLPRQLDESGNNDGYVCGKKAEEHHAENFCGGPCPAQLYNFMDNHRTPEH